MIPGSTMNPPNPSSRTSPVTSAFASRSDRDDLGASPERPTPEGVAHSEGVVARTIEEQTAKLPSDVFLWCALGAMGISLALQLAGKKSNGLFVGQWAAPFLLMGVYNKLVKIGGSDAFTIEEEPFGNSISLLYRARSGSAKTK